MTDEMRVASLTDTGRARSNNEDSLLADAPLVAVADGMGGHEGGEVASSIAVEVLGRWKDQLAGMSGRDAADKLAEAFRDANRAVHDKGDEDESLRGMGTTLTAAWVNDNKVALAHVGDSRAYLMRGSNLQQLTEDQNVAQEWVRRGRLTQEEAASSPHRHIILQAIGAEPDGLDVAVATADLRPGDRLVLASDGLFGMLKSNDVLRNLLLAHPDNDEACRALIDAANDAGGADNISVVILEIPADPDGAGDDADEVLVERPVAPSASDSDTRSPSHRRFGIPRLGIVAIGAAVVLALMLVLLIVRPTGAYLVVSTRGGIVVVLDGRTGDEDTPATGTVVRRFTDERLDEFPPPTQRQLRAGYEVASIEEGRSLVDGLPHQLGPRDTPTPEPEESASPDPSATPNDTVKP